LHGRAGSADGGETQKLVMQGMRHCQFSNERKQDSARIKNGYDCS
jgi:hypothetical protein